MQKQRNYSRGRGSGFSFTIANDHRDDQLGLIHDSTESNSKRVSEFTTFVN